MPTCTVAAPEELDAVTCSVAMGLCVQGCLSKSREDIVSDHT